MNKGKYKGEIYRELTPAGIGLCIITGAAAEAVVFCLTGIRIGNVPVPVLLFLWGLFGILTSGVLLAADTAATWIQTHFQQNECMDTTDNTVCTNHNPAGAQIIYQEFWKQDTEANACSQRKAS